MSIPHDSAPASGAEPSPGFKARRPEFLSGSLSAYSTGALQDFRSPYPDSIVTAAFRSTVLSLLAGLAGILCFTGVPSLANAQKKNPETGYTFSHSLTGVSGGSIEVLRTASMSAPETLRILAAMVAFKPDNDERTTGTGSFDLTTPSKRYIDMPPHNRQYFADHFTFVRNYFQRSSNNKLVIVGTMLDNVYTLPKTMSTYSPTRTSSTNPELGALVTEAWHQIDSLTPGIQYENYQLFALFHAGAGHDIDFVSIYGYDPTPFDIPSLYMGMPSLRKIYGDSYAGIPVRNGTYFLQNTMVLPETETREISGIGGTALLKLSLNGLVAASIGSYLGLPDLFDTKTGASGIGRFGLMDGQSIFSWNGAFPPEPSAWEKASLGWVDPITVLPGTSLYDLPAVSLSAANDTIYRVPISSGEYFLVENRNRDAHVDGSTITLSTADGVIQKTWVHDTTTGFNAFNQDSLYGVITDVDEFDWSLPGGVNTRTHEFFDGGVLIWHIDEAVINAKRITNEVNADPNHRGVNLEEADGSQDIGQSYGLLGAGSGSEEGTQLDFWYAGNQAPLRFGSGNRFTPTSFPNSKSNYGGNSHITIRDFSARAPRMQAKIILGDSLVRPVAGFPKAVGSPHHQSIKFGGTRIGPSFFLGLNRSVYGWNTSGEALFPFSSPNGLLISFFQPNSFHSIVGSLALNPTPDAASPDLVFLHKDFETLGSGLTTFVHGFRLEDSNSDNSIDQLYATQISGASTGPVLGTDFVAWGDTVLKALPISGSNPIAIAISDSVVGVSSFAANSSRQIVVGRNGKVSIVELGTATGVLPSKQFAGLFSSPAISGNINTSAGNRIVFVSDDGAVHCANPSLDEVANFPVMIGGDVHNAPAIADIDGDGSKDIVVFSANKIWAINSTGAILANFPITVSSNLSLLTSPVVADIDQNGTPDIVAVTREGLIVAYDKSGKMSAGFPVQSGPNYGSTPAVFSSINPACLACRDTVTLAVASSDGNVYAYRAGAGPAIGGAVTQFPWPQYMHDAQNSGFDGSTLAVVNPTSSFFPAASAYNWPNPVGSAEGYKTHIRYYVGADAAVTVKVFDLAGDLVTTFNKQATGGMDNEFEWDVTGVQSGVYFARIEAQGAAQQGSAIIKIAVIK